MAKKGKKQKPQAPPDARPQENQENIEPEVPDTSSPRNTQESLQRKSVMKSVTYQEETDSASGKKAKKGKQKKGAAEADGSKPPKKKQKMEEPKEEELKEIAAAHSPTQLEAGGSLTMLPDEGILTAAEKSRDELVQQVRSKIELRMSIMRQSAILSLSELRRVRSSPRTSGTKKKAKVGENISRSKVTLTSEASSDSSEDSSMDTLEDKKELAKKPKKRKGKGKEEEIKHEKHEKHEKLEKPEKPEPVEEVVHVADEKPPKKKGKKGTEKKEGKKEDKKKEEKEIDPISELKRIGSLLKTLGAELPQTADDFIKAPKKKGKKEKTKLTAEMLEKARIEAEAQAKRLEELMKKKREEERRAAMEKDKKETLEQIWRMEQLERSCHFIDELTAFNNALVNQTKEESEWQKYVACGRLPNPFMCDQMSTYLHLWENAMDIATMEDASSRTKDVIRLLSELDELIDTASGSDLDKVENWIWIRQLFREHQMDNLNVTTYHLLRDIEHNLNRINIPTADYNFKDDYLTLCIWLRVQLPIPLPNPRRPPKARIDISLSLLEMDILFPTAIDGDNAAIRAMYLKYDHLSDNSSSYNMPDVPPEFNMNILEYMNLENRRKLKYKYDNRDKAEKKIEKPRSSTSSAQTETAVHQYATDEKEKEIPQEPAPSAEKEEFASDEDIPVVPFKQLKPTASEHVISLEDDLYTSNRENLSLTLDDSILNLRRFKILGGVFHIDLLQQPPQPQDFITMEMTLTALYLPKRLETVPFHVPYLPPAASDASVRKLPEEIEEEMKRQEEEFDKLILITLKWPQHVIFLELPIVCYWDQEEKHWTKSEVHDVKHNEEKSTLTFRTGIFGVFGLATYKYVNLPFQAYDLKPEADGSVSLQLTASILILEFNVKDGKICLSQLQNSPNNALQDIVGTYFELHKLRRMMQDAGIDIFPDFDAFCYIEGSCEKHWPAEKHLYYNMAQMANCFNFAWSRWNIQAGRRKMVLQMREYVPNKTKQKNHQMLLVTPLRATFVECTEVSQVFSEKESDAIKFSADLYHLMKFSSGIHVRNRVLQASKENVYALSQLLITTRVLSFS